MGSPLRSKDTDNSCGRFNKYCCLCAVFLGNEKKKCEVVSMLPHEQSCLSIRFFLNRCEFNELHSSLMRLCSIYAISDTCKVSKYLGTRIWLFLNVCLKLLRVGAFRVSGLSTFQSLKAVGKNEL